MTALALRSRTVVVLTILIFAVCGANAPSEPRRRFEYKLSFKGPLLVQRDGSIPFWTHGGHSIASDDSIRITPSLKSKKGYVWSNERNAHPFWEVDMVFRVSGRGRVGADGLALWYTAQKGVEGPVFGSNDKWEGLAVFFDSFDNDNQHNNPYVMVMVNDGTQSYSHETDGSHQQLGGCLRDFRNKPFPVRVRVQYYKKTLTVWYHSGMSDNVDHYELCMRAESVTLPAEGYFGVSAATGGLADDHDVHSFLTHSLREPDTGTGPGTVLPEEDLKKYEAEFDEYGHKLDKAREEYQKEHPEAKHHGEQDENVYESQDIRELNLIYAGQNAIHETMNELNKKMNNLISRNDRIVTQIEARGVPVQGGGGTGGAVGIHEIEEVLSYQKQLTQSLTDMRAVLDHVSSRIVQSGATGQGGDNKLNDAILGHVTSIQNDLRTLANKPGSANCPQSSCVTTFYLFLFMSAQVAAGVVYVMYKNHKEAAAKKFY